MSEHIASELKNWFFSLGFQDKNLTADQIEEEFQRLSPPELRDIWRSVMLHVVPAQEARYIRKVLMLHQLKKYHATKRIRPRLTNNIKNIHEFELSSSNEDVLILLGRVHQNIFKNEAEVKNLKTKILEKEAERKKLLKKKEQLDHLYILIDLKISDREKMVAELSEMQEFLSYINSFWNSDKDSQEIEIIKECLKLVNEFGKQRNLLQEDELIKEKENLMNNIVKLTSKIPASNLYKIVIHMLKDTLSALLKLSDHINPKQEPENSWLLESKLLEFKKECVHVSLENKQNKKRLQALAENVQTIKSDLFMTLNNHNYMGFQKENLKIWLDSECEKHCLVTRNNFLRKELEEIESKNDKTFDFSNVKEREEFFTNIKDSKNQLLLLEHEITTNLSYLSDDPIDMFISCQDYCINRIQRFINEENTNKLINFSNSFTGSLTNEVFELRCLNLPAIFKNLAFSDTAYNDLPCYYVNVLTEQCYYLIHLSNAHRKLVEKINQPVVKPESLIAKKNQIKEDQEKFLRVLKKSIIEAKNNLKNVEHYATECSKNIELWVKLSVNEIIPKNMIVADRTFMDWLKRYISVIQCLRKKKTRQQDSM